MKDFKKYFLIPAEVTDVYMALTHPNSLLMWTGEPVIMSAEIGSEFSLWSGNIVGKNLDFEENKKIVQEWYFGETDHPSIVTIKLHEKGSKTDLEISHTNIPDADFNDIAAGWRDVYIAGLIEFFEE
jgi:activator of HSP90 ATPase